MKKMKKYLAYLDAGDFTYKVIIPAFNKKEVIDYCEGNGEIIKIKDVSDDLQYKIDCDKLCKILKDAEVDTMKYDLIIRSLEKIGIIEY